jgi:hypothetical protein
LNAVPPLNTTTAGQHSSAVAVDERRAETGARRLEPSELLALLTSAMSSSGSPARTKHVQLWITVHHVCTLSLARSEPSSAASLVRRRRTYAAELAQQAVIADISC